MLRTAGRLVELLLLLPSCPQTHHGEAGAKQEQGGRFWDRRAATIELEVRKPAAVTEVGQVAPSPVLRTWIDHKHEMVGLIRKLVIGIG